MNLETDHVEDGKLGPDAAVEDPVEQARRRARAHVDARRVKAGLDEAERSALAEWGLALSGGGVRSATFCLGVVRALAQHGLLRRMDYLSTVSGGGYLGASIGRLFGTGGTAKQVEAGIARDDSLWLWWLRVNGRFLTPAGAKDLGIAGASILRGVLATYLELTSLILLLVFVILLPHLLVTIGAIMQPAWLKLGILSTMGSAWFWLALLPLTVAAQQACAFWCGAMHRSSHALWLTLAGTVVLAWLGVKCLALAYDQYMAFGTNGVTTPRYYFGVNLFAGTLAFAPLLGALEVLLAGTRDLSHKMLVRTTNLATALAILAGMLAMGALDAGSWLIADRIRLLQLSAPSVNIALLATAVVAALRLSLPSIKTALAQARSRHINVERLLNIVGLACLALLVLIWTIAIHAIVIPPELWQGKFTAAAAFNEEMMRWLVILGVPLLYVVLSGRNYNALNFSSLHEFYRARIELAYVAVGNVASRFAGDPLRAADVDSKNSVTPLQQALREDDIDVLEYAPHEHGGPIHIVNCCINQSIDDRTESYNADRKGVALGISRLGVEVGTAPPQPPPEGISIGPLSKWVAISGAAASTGMGSGTSAGLAALLFLSGLRLGFWTPRLRERQLKDRKQRLGARLRGRLFEWMPKPVAIVAEAVARFPGLESPAWYVSDGGHFDNTGIYPLIKRELDVIVAVDAAADSNYLFEDLESLVRKARLDFGAHIEFYQGDDFPLAPDLAGLLESPEQMSPLASPRCLLVGRIAYRSGKIGTLIVLKPRRLDEMPFDVVAYADRELDFPQQTTADQFFDEAQWESYHRLGLEIGRKLSPSVLAEAVALSHSTYLRPRSLSALATATSEQLANRRTRASPAVKASIGVGIGVIVSVFVALWQGYHDSAAQQGDERAEVLAHIKDIKTAAAGGDFRVTTGAEMQKLGVKSEQFGVTHKFAEMQQIWKEKCRSSAVLSDLRYCTAVISESQKPAEHRYWLDDVMFASAPLKANQVKAAAAAAAAVPTAGDFGPAEQCPISQAQSLTLYVQIYDEKSRPAAVQLSSIAAGWGFNTPGIENVIQTADQRGTKAPFVWNQPGLVLHSEVPASCVAQLRQLFEIKDVLVTSSGGAPKVIELWLPPGWE